MQNLLKIVFKIHKGEGLIVTKFVLLFLLLQAGLAIGITTSDSLFLLNIGVDKLPVIYIIMPFVMLCYIPVYSYLTSKYGQNSVFEFTIIALVLGGILFYFLLTFFKGTGFHNILLYLTKIYSSLWFVAIYSSLWSYTYNYFDILDGKRLFSFFTGGSAFGSIIGGFSINVLTNYIEVTNLYLVWSVLAMAAYPILKWIIKTEKEVEVRNLEEQEEVSLKDQILSLITTIRKSRFVVLILLVMIIAQVLTNVCEYQYMDIFSKDTSEVELANLFGKLFIIINFFNLIVSLFVFNRMALRMGVRNIAIIQPVVYCVTFTFLYMTYGFNAALFGFFAYQGVMVAIDYDNSNLLLNALPVESQTHTRAFIEGLAEPLATAIAGVFLLFFGTVLKTSSISLIGLCFSLIYLILVLVMRNEYLAAMIRNLKKSWLDFSKNPNEIVNKLNSEEIEFLIQKGSGSSRQALISIEILWLNNKEAALETFLNFLKKASHEERINSVPIFSKMIKESDADLFRKIIKWIEYSDLDISPELIEEILANGIPQSKYYHLADSDEPVEKAIGAIALWNSWEPEKKKQATSIIQSLINGDDTKINAALTAMGRTKNELYAYYIVPYLTSHNKTIRKTAIKSICQLVDINSKRIISPLLVCINNGDSEDRTKCMEALIKIKNSNCIGPLLGMSNSFTPHDRRKAEQVILNIGLKGVPMAVLILRSLEYPYKGRSIAARALSRLAFPQFEALSPKIIIPELKKAYEFLYYYSILRKEDTSPGLEVLKQFYLDIQRTIVEFVLEVLTLGGKLPDYELVNSSLHSKSAKERGNAIETIEQGVNREVFNLILPLIDYRSIEKRVQFYSENFTINKMTMEEIVLQSLQSNIPLECTAAAQVLWDMDSEKYQNNLRKRLKNSNSGQFKKIVLLFLNIEIKTENMNFIEKIYHLSKSKLFNKFGIQGLEMISKNIIEKYFPTGETIYEAGEKSNAIYCITSGSVKSPDGSINLEKGDIFGENCLFGTHLEQNLIPHDLTALVIPQEILLKNADIFPRTALVMFEQLRKIGEKNW